MHVRSGTTVVSLIRANWRGYSWRQLELSPDFQSLPTQTIYIEKLAGRDWKKEELGESSNYYIISKIVGTPSYLLDLIPPTIKSTTIYPLRNGNDIIVPFCRLSLARDSFVSATVREWNNLNLSVGNLDTLSKFKKAIRSSISMPIPRHYSYGPRKLNTILTQLRCNASFLKFYQMLPVTVAHHVKSLTISFLIVINIQIIGK